MRANTDNDWRNRTTVGYLRHASQQCLNSLSHGNDNPETKEECIQMLYNRVEAHAEHGYTEYSHVWSSEALPRHFLLEEIRDLAREVFLDCNITLRTIDVTSACSSSSNPPVIERNYELTISWRAEDTETTVG